MLFKAVKFAILVWLRHVTWFGTVALSGILAAIFVVWVLLVRWLLPLVANRSFLWRVVAFAGPVSYTHLTLPTKRIE